MKYIHHIYLSVFAKAEEDKNSIVKTLATMLLPEPVENDKNNIKIEEEIVSIDAITKMSIFRAQISKDKQTKEIIKIIKENLSEEDIEKIISQKNRIDEEGNLYLRLDKSSLIEKSEMKLTDSGDCFHVKIQIAAYPKTKEKAEVVVKELFSK